MIEELSLDDVDELSVNEYINRSTSIPIYDDDDKIIATIPFIPNFNVDGPSYLNDSGNMGLLRIRSGKLKGKLVLLFENEMYPSRNRGDVIDETEAYELCVLKGKLNLIKKFNIVPDY